MCIRDRFYLLQSFLMASFAEKLSLRLRSEIGEKLSRMPLAFFDRNKPGTVLSRITNDSVSYTHLDVYKRQMWVR